MNSEHIRQICDEFYVLALRDVQNGYLFGLMRPTGVRCRYGELGDECRREQTFQYFVRVDSKDLRLCKQAICGIGRGRVEYLQKQSKMNSAPLTDGRGRHANRPNKIPEDIIQVVKEHIQSFSSLPVTLLLAGQSTQTLPFSRIEYQQNV